jgi:hypothetical protein
VLVDRRVLVKIEAPREFAFDLLVSDRTTRRTSEDDIVSQEPVSEGPIGVGYQMRSKTLHQGKTCLTLTTVSRYEPPTLLEEKVWHRCSVSGRSFNLRRRYEFYDERRQTLMKVVSNLPAPLGRALLWAIFPSTHDLSSFAAMWDGWGQRVELRYRRSSEQAGSA